MAKFTDKHRVQEKILAHFRAIDENGGKMGTNLRGLQFNYSNACNFNCKHCFTRSAMHESDEIGSKITLDDFARIADEADSLGIYEIDIQGGEPLMYPNLFEIIEAIDPSRFYLYLTSNGYFLDENKARQLAEAGITRVTVSLDGFDAASNDEFRGMPGAYERAVKALKNIRDAGMQPVINFTLGSYNADSPDLERLCAFAHENRYKLAINCATPTGCWHGNTDIMIGPDDNRRLAALRKKYPKLIFRDLWNVADMNHEMVIGCPAVNILYINPAGDALPCPYIQIKLGNVLTQSLREIVEYGFSIRYFRENSDICLSGEDKDFVRRFLSREGMTVMNPIHASEVFASSDFAAN